MPQTATFKLWTKSHRPTFATASVDKAHLLRRRYPRDNSVILR